MNKESQMKFFCSYFTMRMKFLSCLDDSFYKDKTTVPKPINTCTDDHIKIYCDENLSRFHKNNFVTVNNDMVGYTKCTD